MPTATARRTSQPTGEQQHDSPKKGQVSPEFMRHRIIDDYEKQIARKEQEAQVCREALADSPRPRKRRELQASLEALTQEIDLRNRTLAMIRTEPFQIITGLLGYANSRLGLIMRRFSEEVFLNQITEAGVIANLRQPIAHTVGHLIQDGCDNPALCEQILQLIERERQAHHLGQRLALPLEQRQGSSAEPVLERKPRKNAAKVRSPDEIREARRFVQWQSRNKDQPVELEALREARRTVRWADRERQREKERAAKRQGAMLEQGQKVS